MLLMLMILRKRPKDAVSCPAVCPAKFSSEAPIRMIDEHWLSSVRLPLLDPWSHVVQLNQPVHDFSFVRSSQS